MGTSLLIITFLIVFMYWRLPHTFFQQDEWLTFVSNIYFSGKGAQGIVQSLFPVDALSHFNPFSRLFSWVEHSVFSMNFPLFAWKSIALHIVNAWLLYHLVLSLLKKKSIALVSAIFFGVNSIPFQAVTWVAAANSYEIPTALILLSLICFQKRNVRLSFFLLFLSFLFHEVGMFLFLFYPVALFIQHGSRLKTLTPVFLRSLILVLGIFFLVRIPFFFGFISAIPETTDISHPSIAVYPYRLMSIGLKSFAGSFVPEKTLINISEEMVRLSYPQFMTPDRVPNPFIAQSIAFDFVSYVISIGIVSLIFFVINKIKDAEMKRVLVWLVLFIPMSLLPYALVLGKAGYASILEPKFFYVGSIGVSILVAILFYVLIQVFSKYKILQGMAYGLFYLYIGWHMYLVRNYVKELETVSVMRKTFLEKIHASYPNLAKNVVFFTESDTAYYGMPDHETILPVQIGFGKMLMIWYQKDEHFPMCFYEDQFLLNLLEEGYRSCEGRGFGYFRKYHALLVSLKEYNLPLDTVIAYHWNAKKGQFIDITTEIRAKLASDMQ